MRKLYLVMLFIFFMFTLIFLIVNLNKEKQDSVYEIFLIKMKERKYADGFRILYPFAREKEREALELVSRAYLGDYGIDMDMIKSNIWRENSLICLHCNTGQNEFEQYDKFLSKKDHGMASVFLQKAAELGNEKAIYILKDEKFLEQNNLTIEPNWKKYWQDFDYDNLYPFCQEIEACRNDVKARKEEKSSKP